MNFISKLVLTLLLIFQSIESNSQSPQRNLKTQVGKEKPDLKDRKAYKAEVETLTYDQNGKISELELRKK